MKKLILVVMMLVFLSGCGVTQALREMKEGLLEASKKMEFAPVGYHNNTYEETVEIRQTLKEIKNRLDIGIAPILAQNPQLKMGLMQADFNIRDGKPIAKAITAYEFVAPVVNMPGNAVDYTMTGMDKFLSSNGDLIKGGVGVSVPLAILGWGISYFRRKKRTEAEDKLSKSIKDAREKEIADKEAEHDRKMDEMREMHKISVENALYKTPPHLEDKKNNT